MLHPDRFRFILSPKCWGDLGSPSWRRGTGRAPSTRRGRSASSSSRSPAASRCCAATLDELVAARRTAGLYSTLATAGKEDWGGCRCQALRLTGDVAATDPVCRYSPRHETVVAARESAQTDELTYRTMRRPARV